MTWSDIFLICFLVGFVLSLLSFLAGALHLPGQHHGVGHLISHHGGAGLGHHAAGPAVPHGSGGTTAGAPMTSATGQRGGVSLINFSTATAFLAWFGGVGFLMTRYYGAALLLALGGAVAGGFVGAALVFWFFARLLLPHETRLDPAEFDMVGVLGTVTSTIRAGGVGEISFSQGGARRAAPARSETGQPIDKSTEVVVARYEKGIAYVNRWDEMMK